MNLTLERRPSFAGATVGRLSVDGDFVCHTLEDEVREVPGVPVALWKIKGATAIPVGRYLVALQDSARFGPNTLTLLGVPGFAYIRMHAGNSSADTEGCILLGLRASAASLVAGTSRPAVGLVKARVMEAIARGDGTYIEISNATAVA